VAGLRYAVMKIDAAIEAFDKALGTYQDYGKGVGPRRM
jgi:hypothetical protein